MKTIFIIDIDGTICDTTERAKKMCEKFYGKSYDDLDSNIENHKWSLKDMEEFLSEENIMKDKVVKGAENIMELSVKCNAKPIFLTGRHDFCENATRKWLSVNLGVPNNVLLLTRPFYMYKYNTADCKEEVFREEVFYTENRDTSYIFFEDNPETIKRYSRYGLVLKAPECWSVINLGI